MSSAESSEACSREVVKGMCRDWMISIRHACGALNFDRSTYHYTSRRADQAGLERRIREIYETRVRYGYAAGTRRLGHQQQANLFAFSDTCVFNCATRHRSTG